MSSETLKKTKENPNELDLGENHQDGVMPCIEIPQGKTK